MQLLETLTVALILCAVADDAGSTAATPLALSPASALGPRCAELRNKTNGRRPHTEGIVSVYGTRRDVLVYWSDGPPRAAAALMLVLLRHRLNYTRLQFIEGPLDLCQLTTKINDLQKNDTNNILLTVVPTAAWDTRKACSSWVDCYPPTDGYCGLGGPSLMTLGAAAAPVRVRMYVRLSPQARRIPDCDYATSWMFYQNLSAVHLCSFIASNEHPGNVTMYVITSDKRALENCIIPATAPVHVKLVNRTVLTDLVRGAHNSSFLFQDWDMWQRVPAVKPMSADSCLRHRSSCESEPEPVGVRAINDLLIKYAPPLFYFTQHFAPEPHELREILELEASRNNGIIEEAACDWANNHQKRVQRWLDGKTRFDYSMLAILCQEDPLVRDGSYHKLTTSMTNQLYNISKWARFGVNVFIDKVNCSKPENARLKLQEYLSSTESFRAIGVVAGKELAPILMREAALANRPLVLYDVNDVDTPAPVGCPRDLARALISFFEKNKWSRIAVLSDSTITIDSTARKLVKHLEGHLCIRDVKVTPTDMAHELPKLQLLGARVFFLNMESNAARMVLEAATRLGMTPANEYAWVVREWEGAPLPSDMSIFSVSFGCSEDNYADANAELRSYFNKTWPDSWPVRAASYVDAILTMVHGFVTLLNEHPEHRNDREGPKALEHFWKGLENLNATGLCQQLRYKGNSLAEPRVFADKWVGNKHERLVEWRMSEGRIVNTKTHRSASPNERPPSDGRYTCLSPSGDCFAPVCNDVKWALSGVALLCTTLLMPFIVQRVRRAYKQRLDNIKSEMGRTWLNQREHNSQVLANYIVPREQLELREELGAGRSGRVHLALLRSPGRALRAVAVKSLRHDAAPSEEGEFLREACTLVSLDHEHVVRLVGVCIGDPLLVLMEHAFFGDLAHYLCARRHLVEGADNEQDVEVGGVCSEEAIHVSAEALTRLMREAASALAYLAHRGFVHRDVRAANCLVDSRRSLKLGDFGMARKTSEAGADGAAEYACRRRGMFPVLWMAPESLERGAFSAASDVWALGVLMFEVVTLGARPYGACPPFRVLQLVRAGGRPRLPLDATAQTRGVTNACWRRVARERPTASEIVAYLAEHPNALQPALVLDYDEVDVDSGYGEPDVADAADSADIFDRPSPDSATAFFPA